MPPRKNPRPNPPVLLFQVRHRTTGMFATASGRWVTTGKTWTRPQDLNAHLERMDYDPGDAEVVVYEVKVLVVHPTEKYAEAIAKHKARRALTQKKRELANLQRRSAAVFEQGMNRSGELRLQAELLEAEIRQLEGGAP